MSSPKNGHAPDSGVEAELREPKPCCARIVDPATKQYGFCGLMDGHRGEHQPVRMSRTPTPSTFAPKRRGK